MWHHCHPSHLPHASHLSGGPFGQSLVWHSHEERARRGIGDLLPVYQPGSIEEELAGPQIWGQQSRTLPEVTDSHGVLDLDLKSLSIQGATHYVAGSVHRPMCQGSQKSE